MSTVKLSVIIPCINEEKSLPVLLEQLRAQEGLNLEIIICDGGSNDTSLKIADSFECICLSTKKGRAIQMNSGAKKSKNDLIFFCHADSQIKNNRLLKNAIDYFLQKESEDNKNIAGHFSLEFLPDEQNRKAGYIFYERKTQLNRPNTTNGDQGFLLRKSFFQELGAFDTSFPYFEDQRLAEKIREEGKWITLPGKIYSSARRFEKEGLDRRMILSMIAMAADKIKLSVFFKEMPLFYQDQKNTDKLEIIPVLRLLNKISFEAGFLKTLKNWFHLGRYSRINIWQFFFFLDVYLNQNIFLKFHDKVFFKIWDNKIGDFFAAILMFTWMSIIRIIYEFKWWKEGKKPSLLQVLLQQK